MYIDYNAWYFFLQRIVSIVQLQVTTRCQSDQCLLISKPFIGRSGNAYYNISLNWTMSTMRCRKLLRVVVTRIRPQRPSIVQRRDGFGTCTGRPKDVI